MYNLRYVDRTSGLKQNRQERGLSCWASDRGRKDQEEWRLDVWLSTRTWQISMLCISKEAKFLLGKEARVL